MKKTILLSIAVLLCLPGSLSARNYYVSKQGNDQYAGTLEFPFKTISKAAPLMLAGDTCFIKEGVYRETLNADRSGTEGAPIVFTAYDQDKVVINATEEISGWTTHQGNIYKAAVQLTMGVERRTLFYNGELLDIARWPNNADDDPFTFDGHPVSGGSGSHILGEGLPPINWADGYVCYLGAHSGMTWTRKITSSSAGRIDFTPVDITKWPFNPHNPTVLRNGNRGRFYLFGKLQALDRAGEWYYDADQQMVYIMSPDGSSPGESLIEAAAREFTVNIAGDYVQLLGIKAFGGVVKVSGNHCSIEKCTVVHGLQSLDELDNTDAQIGNGAINVEGSNNLIEENLIEFGSGNGVSMLAFWKGSANNTVKNNIIRYFNTIGIHANPIRSNCSGTLVQNNTIYTCGRDGIYVSGADGDISYNDVFDCMKINNDGGVFYTVGNSNLKNSTIHHNWFHDSYGPEYADGRAAGIYLDNHSKGYRVYRNVVWNITWSALQINWDNWEIDFFNNSFWNVGSAMGRWANGYTIDKVRVRNNYSNIVEWIGTDVGNNLVNPASPFANVTKKDFMPAQGSYLIDAGEVIAGVTEGYVGTAPDIGAYEKGGEQWKPGADWLPEGETDPGSGIFDAKVSTFCLNVFPNPSNGVIYISTNETIAGGLSVNLYSLNGTLVHTEHIWDTYLDKGGVRLNNPKLPIGTYLIRAMSLNKTFIGKVVAL